MNSKKIIYSIILASIICLVFSTKVNIDTYKAYVQATGKTKGLYALSEFRFSYKYYIGIFSLICLAIATYFFKTRENRQLVSIALSISILATIISFFRIWKIFIDK